MSCNVDVVSEGGRYFLHIPKCCCEKGQNAHINSEVGKRERFVDLRELGFWEKIREYVENAVNNTVKYLWYVHVLTVKDVDVVKQVINVVMKIKTWWNKKVKHVIKLCDSRLISHTFEFLRGNWKSESCEDKRL